MFWILIIFCLVMVRRHHCQNSNGIDYQFRIIAHSTGFKLPYRSRPGNFRVNTLLLPMTPGLSISLKKQRQHPGIAVKLSVGDFPARRETGQRKVT